MAEKEAGELVAGQRSSAQAPSPAAFVFFPVWDVLFCWFCFSVRTQTISDFATHNVEEQQNLGDEFPELASGWNWFSNRSSWKDTNDYAVTAKEDPGSLGGSRGSNVVVVPLLS